MGSKHHPTETRRPSRAYLKAHYAEKAWKHHDEYDVVEKPAIIGPISTALDTLKNSASKIKTARVRSNLAVRAACLDEWERRLKLREKRLADCEDSFENVASVYTRRANTVMRVMRLQWGREKACWWHHGAGVTLLLLILGAILTIAAHWQVRDWQCNQWQGMACWGVMGYTVIAGMSYICRIWVEERATDTTDSGAFVFACIMPFLHFTTCLSAALWSVGIGAVCHAN